MVGRISQDTLDANSVGGGRAPLIREHSKFNGLTASALGSNKVLVLLLLTIVVVVLECAVVVSVVVLDVFFGAGKGSREHASV